MTDADYDTLSHSDKGYVSPSVRKTDGNGQAEWTGLYTGIYFLKETKAPEGYRVNVDTEGNVEVKEIAVSNGSFGLTLTNAPAEGKIRIVKSITNEIDGISVPESGAKFTVTDGNDTLADTIVTDGSGTGESKSLSYGTYTVKQISGAQGTVLCEPWTVTIDQENSTPVFEKEDPLWTASVSVHKEEAGTKTPLVASFELCERHTDGTVKVLQSGTTDNDGDLTFSRGIVYTDGVCNSVIYFVRETEAPTGYALDTEEYPVSCTCDDQEISVTVENTPTVGSIELHKRSSSGEVMKGVKFLLEYSSDDGGTWVPAAQRNDDDPFAVGSCSAAVSVQNGTALTDDNGILRFEGLRVFDSDGEPVQYRITELETLNGYSLIPGHVWEGCLTEQSDGSENYGITLDVVNSPILELPNTGSNSALLFMIAAALFAGMGATLLITRRKKVD